MWHCSRRRAAAPPTSLAPRAVPWHAVRYAEPRYCRAGAVDVHEGAVCGGVELREVGTVGE